MSYFEEKTTDTPEVLLSELSDICLEELMLSSDAYICMIKLNMHGYKRLHRYLTKKFQSLYLELQNESIERYDRALPSEITFKQYKPIDIKEHLETWTEELHKHLKRVGVIIRKIFEQEGYISCRAQELQKLLYYNMIKNERSIKKFNDCDWSYETIYLHDHELHKKMKQKEEHRD